MSLSADRSLGTRSFLTIEATSPQNSQVLTETLDEALVLLTERYNIAIAFDPSSLVASQEELTAQVTSIDEQIEALIADEAIDINNRLTDSDAYLRYELARNQRFQLERERNSILDRINAISGRLLSPELDASPSDQLRVLLAARLVGETAASLAIAIALASGVAVLAALAIVQTKRDTLPLRLKTDLTQMTNAPVLTTPNLDPAEIDDLVAGLLTPPGDSSAPERAVVTVQADGSVDLPEAGAGQTVLVVPAGAISIGDARELVDQLRWYGNSVSASLLTTRPSTRR